MNAYGWKDILRPIRDGFRHYFPNPDTGPTPEERRKQQKLDALKGFTYFDTFNQLENWSYDHSDLMQRSNTPLLPRSSPVSESASKQTANVLLCHDYGGNYHDYESSQRVGVDEETYTCEYLQFVETFVYFSHKLVCVPPPSWTNTLHRNGVKVLGTFLVEPALRESNRMLENSTVADTEGTQLHFPFARKLSAIAKHYGFDGWLMNIEKPFDRNEWNLDLLLCFLRQLRSELGSDSKLIWYDALTVINRVAYQNSLTHANLPFAQACHGILTNYCWKEAKATESKDFARLSDLPPKNVYFGVDVWAQNTSKSSKPRVTYPKEGGGGTHTGLAVTKLAQTGLSVGIFAPAWSFEHFDSGSRGVERAMWDGESLPDNVNCSCDGRPHDSPYPIVGSTGAAREYPAGSESFFYTDFDRGFGSHGSNLEELYGGKRVHSQLGAQSLLPYAIHRTVLEPPAGSVFGFLYGELLDQPSRLAVYHELIGMTGPIRLFKVDMPADGSLQLKICYKNYLASGCARLALKIGSDLSMVDLNMYREPTQTTQFLLRDLMRKKSSKGPRLSEIYLSIDSGESSCSSGLVMEIFGLSVLPVEAPQLSSAIWNVRVESRGEDDQTRWQIVWDYKEENALKKAIRRLHLPYSQLTGPFAYFSVDFDGDVVGRAYAAEYVLNELLVARLRRDTGAKVSVVGVGFDGQKVESGRAHLVVR